MKEQWVFKYKGRPLKHGYSHQVKLVNQARVLKVISVNLESNYTNKLEFFPENFLTDHKDSFIKMSEIEKKQFNQLYGGFSR